MSITLQYSQSGVSGFNVNINLAEACGYYTDDWLKDAVHANSCPPICTNNEKNDTVNEFDMAKILSKLEDFENLEIWYSRKKLSNKHRQYVQEETPSFKEMKNKEIFDDMEKIVKEIKHGK